MERVYKITLLFIASAILFSVGCAWGPSTIEVNYAGDLLIDEAFASLSPVVFHVHVTDDRDYKGIVGNKENTYGMIMGQVVTSLPVEKIVQDAITKELEKYGHTVDASHASEDTQIMMDCEVTNFWVGPVQLTFKVETTAKIQGVITLTDVKTSEPLVSNEFLSTHSTLKYVLKEMTFQDDLNQALKKFIKQITNHEEFIEACRIDD